MALEDDISALQAALRQGVKRVVVNGREVTYQSRAEMVATLREMKREAGMITSASTTVTPEFSKDT